MWPERIDQNFEDSVGWDEMYPTDYQPADPVNPADIPGGTQMNNARTDAIMRLMNAYRTQ